ncbi:MAG TPA: MFS transporter, partial [Polyangiales bacterium]|nr:MFS transporter [Polyangiales bacterium]
MSKGRYFRGWEVVAGCFVMAMVSWGLGFYGTGLYLAYLVGERGMPISAVSGGITAYFWLSALMIMSCGPLIDRAGPRLSVSIGTVAMVLALSAIARVEAVWQFYAALGLLAISWTTMTSSAINAILAPWFVRKRGMALSLALTGASFGGIAVVPLVSAAIHAYGERKGLTLAAAGFGALILLVAWR